MKRMISSVFLLSISLLSFISSSHAKNEENGGYINPLEEWTSKCGVIDKTGNIVIPFIYDVIYDFSEGLAAVNKNGKCGFIDKTGNVVIPMIYDRVGSFSEGLAVVKRKWDLGCNFIDKTGKELIQMDEYGLDEDGYIKYDYANDFNEGFANVNSYGKWGFIDKTGKEMRPFYDFAWCFSGGLAAVKKNNKQGFIDKKGKVVISIIYDRANSFSEGLAVVRKRIRKEQENNIEYNRLFYEKKPDKQ